MLRWVLFIIIVLLPLSVIVAAKSPIKSLILPAQKPVVSPLAKTTPAVLPAKTSLTPTASLAKRKESLKLQKSTYSIAIIGDSMVDTMGENLEYLDRSLKEKYPETSFKLYNYGIGAQNVAMGLSRFNSPFTNRERNYPSITQINADVIVVGSFSYNPFDPHDAGRHRAVLAEVLNEAKKSAPQVYLLVEIAPLGKTFGRGTNGVNLPEDKAQEHALRIIEQLRGALQAAKEQNVGIINVFSATQVNPLGFGNRLFVDGNDGIHPSPAGHQLMADFIVAGVKLR